MILNKSEAVVILKRKSIWIYYSQLNKIVNIEFAPDVFNHLKILNLRRFNSEIVAFLSKHKPRKAILILSEETLPANTAIYLTIVDIFERLGWKVKAVLPITVFDFPLGSVFTKTHIKQILKKQKFVKGANLLINHTKTVNLKTKNQKIVLLVSVIVLSCIYIAVFLIRFQMTPRPQVVVAKPVISQSRALPASSTNILVGQPVPASASAILNKEDLKIQVLNGSGILGQGAKLRDKLLSAGFLNVDVGNSYGSKNSVTEIIINKNVSKNLQDELLSITKKTFYKTTAIIEESTSKFDVTITTGK